MIMNMDLNGRLQDSAIFQNFLIEKQHLLQLPYIIAELETCESAEEEQGIDLVLYSLEELKEDIEDAATPVKEEWFTTPESRNELLKFLKEEGLSPSDFKEVDRCSILYIG